MLFALTVILSAASIALSAVVQRDVVDCPGGVLLSSQMIGSVNMTTVACPSKAQTKSSAPAAALNRKRQSSSCTNQAECVCSGKTVGGLGCVEFTGLGVPLVSDCTIIHNTLLVIEGTFGATFFLDPNTHLTLTSGTCEYQFSNKSPGQIEACWQDSWATVGAIITTFDCLGGTTNGGLSSDITFDAPMWEETLSFVT